MIFALFFLIAIALIGARYLFAKTGIYLPPKLFRILIGTHLCLFLMTLSAFVLSSYNIYWRGYRSTSIIIIATAFTGLLCVWLYKGKPFGLFMIFVSIQTFVASILVGDINSNYRGNLFYNDKHFRLENTDRFLMAHPVLPDLFIKNGFFEKRVILKNDYPVYLLNVYQIKSTSILMLSQQKIQITFWHTADTISGIKNPIIINVDLNQ